MCFFRLALFNFMFIPLVRIPRCWGWRGNVWSACQERREGEGVGEREKKRGAFRSWRSWGDGSENKDREGWTSLADSAKSVQNLSHRCEEIRHPWPAPILRLEANTHTQTHFSPVEARLVRVHKTPFSTRRYDTLAETTTGPQNNFVKCAATKAVWKGYPLPNISFPLTTFSMWCSKFFSRFTLVKRTIRIPQECLWDVLYCTSFTDDKALVNQVTIMRVDKPVNVAKLHIGIYAHVHIGLVLLCPCHKVIYNNHLSVFTPSMCISYIQLSMPFI